MAHAARVRRRSWYALIELAFVAITALLGWAALFPARRALGPWAYLTLSWPLGLLAWPVSAAVTSVLGLPMRLPWIAAGALGFAVLASFGFARAARYADGAGPAWWMWAAHLAAIAVLTIAVGKLRLFFSTGDSWYGYQALGILLHDTGIISKTLAQSRGLLLPSMHAANLAMGGDMLVAAYPVAAAHVVSAVAWAQWRFSFARMKPVARGLAAGGFAAAMATGDLFVFHALYVHSHMLTACYLLLGVIAVVVAGTSGDAEALPWLAAGGLATAGLVLARPDGLTYAYIIAALVLAAFFEAGARPRRLVAFFAPLLGMIAVTHGAEFARLGMWQGDKLTGATALAQFAGLALLPALAAALAGIAPVAERLARRGVTIRLALGVLALGVLAVAVLRPDGLAQAAGNMSTNLFSAGGWGLFWVWATGVVLLALLFGGVRRRAAASAELLGALGLFFAVALIVHGVSHPGRLGPADSFNRVAFHVVPLVWLLAGSMFGSALHAARKTTILE